MSGAVLFQSMPPLSPEEYEALASSIREHGIQVPILVDENDVVIDGHHRRKIADELGIACPRRHVVDLDDTAKRALSLSLNLDRRHLTREQRRALVAESLKADPQLSNREHARRTGADHKTVGATRSRLESGGEIPHHEIRIGADGVAQPAAKPGDHLRRATWPERRDNPERIDPATGEVVDGVVLREADFPELVDFEAAVVSISDVPPVPGTTTPTARKRTPLPDAIEACVREIQTRVERLNRLAADDRLPQNRDKVAVRNHSDLVRIINALQRVTTTIGQPAN